MNKDEGEGNGLSTGEERLHGRRAIRRAAGHLVGLGRVKLLPC